MNNLCKVAVVGRPNVGKSTLFNRFIGKKHALVDNTPGVTRDRREGRGKLFDLFFTIVDTAGLELQKTSNLQAVMEAQTQKAIDLADIIVFMIDGKEGVTPLDRDIANQLRASEKTVVLLVNKLDGRKRVDLLGEAYGLGLGDAIAFSAAHGQGLEELYHALMPTVDRVNEQLKEERSEAEANKNVQLSIIGQPNAGKSTLINAILKEERVITGPEAGMTRDAISIDWQYKNTPLKLVDTAGIRKSQKVHEKLEKLSISDARRAIEFSHVVVLLMDATSPLEKQDMKLAKYVIDEGRGLVIALNKWDAVKNKRKVLDDVAYKFENQFSAMKDVPVIPISALETYNIYKLLDKAIEVYHRWNLRFTTSQLNKWVSYVTTQNPPPLAANGKRVKIKYATQVRNRPPALALYCNLPKEIPKSYDRYLQNALRDAFDTQGVPVRLYYRGGDNPYVSKK